MSRNAILAVLTAVALSPTVSSAANYYVSTTGNDANSGAETSPYRSVQRGADAARAGDTVYIMAGTYNESGRPNPAFSTPARGIVLQYSGATGSPITFKPYPGHEGQVVIDQCATGPTTSCAQNTTARAYAGFIMPPGRGYITIEGLEIKNAGTAAIWVASSPTEAYSYGVVIRNNHIHDIWGNDNTGGIRPDLTDGIVIDGNRIHDVYGGGSVAMNASGIHTYLMRNATITNNELYNTNNGIRDKWPDPVGNVLISGNMIHDVSTGFRIGGATGRDVAHDHRFTQNVVFNATSCIRTVAELSSPTTLIQIWNNTFVDCGWGLSLYYYPDARVWNNIFATSVNAGNNYYTNLMLVNDRSHLTYSNYNLFYFYPNIPQNYAPLVVGETGSTYYSLAQWRSTTGYDANSITNDPLFVDKAGHDFRLQAGSPARAAGYSGADIGAYGNVLNVAPSVGGGTGAGGSGGTSGGGGSTGGSTGGSSGGSITNSPTSTSATFGSGGCSMSRIADFDPTLVLILTLAFAQLVRWRVRGRWNTGLRVA